MKKTVKLILFLNILIFGIFMETKSQNNNPRYTDINLNINERVKDLILRMTLPEKISQLSYNAPAIERLNIPKYNWWNECLHGVARAGIATVFPQSITLANSWDTELMYRVAVVISDEARAKHHESERKDSRGIYEGLTFWSPNINIFRDPRWGRGHETYGEDPYLTGEMGYSFVRGLQGDDPKYLKVIATPKHYAVHSGPEPIRHTFDAVISQKDLMETYLPAFRRCIVDGKAYSIMCAYNRFRGKPCCGSDELLINILREKWGFEGYVVSDCGAVEDFWERHKVVKTPEEASSLAVKMGTDLCCGDIYNKLNEAVQKGLITEEEINISLERLFKARFKLGMFDPPEMVPYTKIPYSVNNSPEHDKLALEAARKSIVLLKNENNILPLNKNFKKIAVIGPNADEIEVLLGNYNGTPSNPVTILKGIRNKLPEAEIKYAQGCNIAGDIRHFSFIPANNLKTPDGMTGLKAEYFNNTEFKGEPDLIRIDKEINFLWSENSPDPKINKDNFSVRWSGCIIPEYSGMYQIGALTLNNQKVYIDDSLVLSGEYDHEHRATINKKEIYLSAGRQYKIKFEYVHFTSIAQAELLWSEPAERLLEEAIQISKESELIILAFGLSARLEGEEMDISIDGFKGGDRTNIELPETQLNLLNKIHSLGKPIVLVMLSGGAIAINEADKKIPGIILAGYPGQEAGNAVADVLFGDYNPAGRLPVTYYKSVDQIPAFENYDMIGRTYRYFTGEPLYPFGFGLSYTNFKYSDLKIKNDNIKTGETINLSVKVKNTGKISGDEVIQLYLKHLHAQGPSPIRSLQAFKRINLNAGEEKEIEFTLSKRQISIVENASRILIPGEIEISIGGKQPGFKGNADAITTEVLTTKIKVSGEVIKLED
jgi:beta-glucosidase